MYFKFCLCLKLLLLGFILKFLCVHVFVCMCERESLRKSAIESLGMWLNNRGLV